MRGNLSVRITDGSSDRIVTQYVRDLRFSKVAPGGHHTASMRLVLPRNTFSDLGPADRVYVYDTVTGAELWAGYAENPGVTDGEQRQEYQLSATGGMVVAADARTPVVFIDRSMDSELWTRIDNNAPGATASAGSVPGTGTPRDGLMFQFPAGQPVAQNKSVTLQYQGILRTGQRLYGFACNTQGGKTDSGYTLQAVTRTGGGTGSGEVAASINLTTSTTPTLGATIPTTFPVGRNTVEFRLVRAGATTNVADDNTWGAIIQPYIHALLKNATGQDVTTGVLNYVVRPYEVVGHVVGAMLPMVDGTTAVIDTAAAQWIDHLTYHQGATPRQVLDDMALYEPDFFWEVLGTVPSGKHKFAYRKWPTTPRYYISTGDGFEATGSSDADLCNRVTVLWTDNAERKRVTVVTSTVPELGTRVRDADPIELPDGLVWQESEAQTIGQKVLAVKASPPTDARATLTRPVFDALLARTVQPWEIEAGYVVHVNETGEDLRLTEVEYVDSDGAAHLQLGSPTQTLDQLLAQFANQRR